jgi:hypothetical protein
MSGCIKEQRRRDRQRPKERRGALTQKDRETAISFPAVRPRTSALRPGMRDGRALADPGHRRRAGMPGWLGEEVDSPAFPR